MPDALLAARAIAPDIRDKGTPFTWSECQFRSARVVLAIPHCDLPGNE